MGGAKGGVLTEAREGEAEPCAFLTTHGSFVARDADGRLAHHPVDGPSDATGLLVIDRARGVVQGTDEPVTLRPHGRGTVAIERDGRLLCAGPQGGAAVWNPPGAPSGEWERLLPVPAATLERLLAIRDRSWIIRSRLMIASGKRARLRPDFGMSLGPLTISLLDSLPFLTEELWPFRFPVITTDGRVDELLLFRPLVFTVACRSPLVHAQAFHCLQSLHEFGSYRGDVHVMTDLPPDTLLREVPSMPPHALSVSDPEPSDFVGFVAAKYLIIETPVAAAAQPILFVDPDIVFNAPIERMLIAIAGADTVSAPADSVNPMRRHDGVGADLFRTDGIEPRFTRGFNAGTLGIPNLRDHGDTLALIRRAVAGHADACGRAALRWVDQEIANYVGFRTGRIDIAAITRFVRHGRISDAETPGSRDGLVHFWDTPKWTRHLLMGTYVEALREARDREAAATA